MSDIINNFEEDESTLFIGNFIEKMYELMVNFTLFMQQFQNLDPRRADAYLQI